MSTSRSHYHSINASKRVNANKIAPQISSSLPQHYDLIKYIFDSWSKVNREFREQNFSEGGKNPSITYYKEKEPNSLLKDFEPFDLEAWWGRRVVQNIQTASTSTS